MGDVLKCTFLNEMSVCLNNVMAQAEYERFMQRYVDSHTEQTHRNAHKVDHLKKTSPIVQDVSRIAPEISSEPTKGCINKP